MADTSFLFILALGSNRPLSARLTPSRLLDAAAACVAAHTELVARAPTIVTAPIGPSTRRFANSAMIVRSTMTPPEMLHFIQSIETRLGRRRYRRWGPRSMDIDIILWSGGKWNSPGLVIPHPAWTDRAFVLAPVAAIAPQWRAPGTAVAVRHLLARLRKPKRTTRG